VCDVETQQWGGLAPNWAVAPQKDKSILPTFFLLPA